MQNQNGYENVMVNDKAVEKRELHHHGHAVRSF
jgi:hypothetical protein